MDFETITLVAIETIVNVLAFAALALLAVCLWKFLSWGTRKFLASFAGEKNVDR